jgi:hypothetical protein
MFTDPATALDSAKAQGIELVAGSPGRDEPAAEQVEQPEGGGVGQAAEGVGPEAMIADVGSVNPHRQSEFHLLPAPSVSSPR